MHKTTMTSVQAIRHIVNHKIDFYGEYPDAAVADFGFALANNPQALRRNLIESYLLYFTEQEVAEEYHALFYMFDFDTVVEIIDPFNEEVVLGLFPNEEFIEAISEVQDPPVVGPMQRKRDRYLKSVKSTERPKLKIIKGGKSK